MASTMTVQCPSCDTAFPVDPDKVPAGGVRTQCTVCDAFFRVDHPASARESAPAGTEAPAPVAEEPWEGDTAALEDDWAPASEEVGAEFHPGDLPVLEGTEPAPEHPDVSLEEALEPTPEEVEPLEAMEAGEPEDGAGGTQLHEAPQEGEDDWSGGLGDDWVLEREEDASFGDLEVEVERLDTVEEVQRTASQEDSFASYIEAEVVLTPGEWDEAVEEPAGPGHEAEAEVPVDEAQPAPAEEAPEATVEEAPQTPGFQFGRRDPHEKARRLARVLVSDMITYNPDRHVQALETGTLAQDFDEEIGKSWAEYVEQVGQELAESTSYWRDALNEILAKGEPLF